MKLDTADISPTIWLIRNNAMWIYKNGKVVGEIPDTKFHKIIRDMAEYLDSKE
jgi:hypothetical protein